MKRTKRFEELYENIGPASDSEFVPKTYCARYYRNFSVGQSTHIVKIYDKYTDESGLENELEEFESGRMLEIVNRIKKYLTTVQLEGIKDLMRDKQDGIILPDGKYKKY